MPRLGCFQRISASKLETRCLVQIDDRVVMQHELVARRALAAALPSADWRLALRDEAGE